VLLEQKVNEVMSGCHPSYLKTVSQQVVCGIRTHSFRFLTPNTAILVGKMVKSPKIFVSGENLIFFKSMAKVVPKNQQLP
jgi:hypothetical protein